MRAIPSNLAKPTLMKREELEIKINDAADGLLNPSDLNRLEEELKAYPGLMEEYRSVMSLPDFSGIYGSAESHRNDIHVHRILKQLEQETPSASFDHLTITWFKKYALAASLLILATTSAFYFSQPELLNGDFSLDEMIYSFDISSGDDYVHYLSEWIDD
jgi:hypothetical protein